MYASLAQPDEDVEIHWFNVRMSSFGSEFAEVSQLRHAIRAARQGVQPDLWFRPFITSRTQRIAGKMLPFSYSPISVLEWKEATASNFPCLRSLGTDFIRLPPRVVC